MKRFQSGVALMTVVIGTACGLANAGSAVAQGSDSTIDVVKDLAAAFSKNTGHTMTIEGGGSSNGAKACLGEKVDFAFMSRAPKEKEIKEGLVGKAYALDGVAVIVHSSNETTDFTLEELHDIYTGKTTTWANGKKITAVNRIAGSGTRECFEHIVMHEESFAQGMMEKHDASGKNLLGKVPTAMYYTSAGGIHEGAGFTVCTVNGVEPTVENIQHGEYTIQRQLFMATKGEPTGVAAEFFAFALSDEGQAIVAKAGFVPLKKDGGVSVSSVDGGE